MIHIDCEKTTERLTPYLDGELPPPEAEKVADHLSVCRNCAVETELIRGLNSVLDAVPSMPTPRAFAKETVKKAISQIEGQYSFSDWWRSVTFAWKAAACSVALAGIILGGMLAKQPFGQAAPIAGINKILFAENEPSLSKTYTMALLAGGER